jgi:hypothetical protein
LEDAIPGFGFFSILEDAMPVFWRISSYEKEWVFLE